MNRIRRTARDRIATFGAATMTVLFAVIVAATGGASTAGAVNALPAPGWTLTTTLPTTNVADGQQVTVNVRSNADIAVNALEIRECRWGATYASDADLSPDAGNCPPRAVSTSADSLITRGASNGLTILARSDGGASVPFLVGAGVVEWTGHTLSCDPKTPCALVVKLSVGADKVYRALKLTFADSDPVSACGGAANGALVSGGPDDLIDAWSTWTKESCNQSHSGAPTLGSFSGEDTGIAGFAGGDFDIAYTAAGYDKAVGIAAGVNTRPAVAVPVALNASIITAGGGQHQLVNSIPLGDKVPYADGTIALTANEVGATFGGGQSWINRLDKPYQNSILNRNPALQEILYAPDTNVLAPAQTLSSTWFMTRYLSTRAADDFIDPTVAPAARRPTTASLAKVTPHFDQIQLYTGRPALARVTRPAALSATDGPVWAMTTLPTARALGLTPVAIDTDHGFVAPTPASMATAVAAMKPDENGLLVPDPVALAATEGAYPMTYVVYALVPAQPLVDTSSCTARIASQTLMTSWLTYVTTTGQQSLPAGLEPLPSALASQARSAIAKVGTSPVTGKCAGKVSPPSPGGGGSNAANGGTASSSGNVASIPGANVPSASSAAVPSSSNGSNNVSDNVALAGMVNRVGKPATIRAAEVAVKIPAFAGRALVGIFGAAVALIAIAVITSLGAWLTAARWGSRWDARRVGLLALLWGAVAIAGIALVAFQLGPSFQEREQHHLLSKYATSVSNAANEAQGLQGVTTPTRPPNPGAPTAVVEIGSLHTQNVVVEGVASVDTQSGPGHVPGTAGLGQPGNSVIVARRNGFGGAFKTLGDANVHDRIVVTTTQGVSVYEIHSVKNMHVGDVDAIYGPTDDDRLTLVTSASRAPWETSDATVVVAKMLTKPFAPTPQRARTNVETGLTGDHSQASTIILLILVYAAVVAGSVWLYRTLRFRAAYILSVAPLVAVTVVAGETISRLLPAWT